MALKVGVIGLGKMGILHTAQLKTIKDAEVAAATDAEKRLAQYSKNINPDIPFFSDVENMLDSVPLDAVYICTPAFTHAEISELCSNYNVHQFIEKPLAESLESAKKIARLEKPPRIIIATGYSFAFHPIFQKVKELLEKKTLGRIFRVNSSTFISVVLKKQSGWLYEKEKSGGGIVINSASHLVHLLWWYFGDVKQVFSKAQSLYSEVEDCAFVTFEFKNGVQGIMDSSWSIPGFRLQEINLIIEGQNGKMEVTNDMIKMYLHKSGKEFKEGWTTLHKIDLGDSADFFLGSEEFNIEDKHFVECCLREKIPLVSGKDGFEVQRIIEGIYLSAESNRIVDMDKEIFDV
jgi:predicted dehydrogenase